ncbi:hypothetical protein GCM10007939_03840 [Amylibacter marinus]|uniref:Arsenate reductase n=1 Tax=Amylibacter marinus TaxID=1475483 RepID=A0ABQ5VSD7_9RHOB|nr:Spx/MgsR family RNA polymerase-binding regulatory protein [Amylibacter marinus]GLQ34101.1 hypothetical protein GCM10007939_03840 [Amylibacter marinus]
MKLYGLKNCDTCTKARKALSAQGYDVEFIDVRQTPMTKAELQYFFALFGDELLNKRSTTWRQLAEADRDAESVDLIFAHPTLMKRPVITDGEKSTLGWAKETPAKYL